MTRAEGGNMYVIYPAFRFFQDLALVYPVYTIMFRMAGLDYLQVGALLAIWAAAVALLEIPSGFMADVWRRDLTLAVAMAAKALGFLAWMVWPEFRGFALGFVLWGIQEALVSGTADALVYDSLYVQGKADDFERVAGRGALAGRMGIVVSIALGGWVFARSGTMVLLLSMAAMGVAAVLAVMLPDRRGSDVGDTPGTASGEVLPGKTSLGSAVLTALRIPGLPLLVLFGSFVTVLYGVLDEFDFLFARNKGVPLEFLGLWGMVRFGLEGVGAALASRFAGIGDGVNDRDAGDTAVVGRMVAMTAAAGVLLLLGTVFGLPGMLVFYFLYYGVMAAVEVLYQGRVQRRIGSRGRATVSSVVSFLYTALGMVLGLLMGSIADVMGLSAIFPMAATATLVAVVLYIPVEKAS